MNTNLPRSPEIARNADFKNGYAEGIRNASAIAMEMPLTKKWTDITERISDTNVQAMAWRASMAILKLLPTEKTPDIGSVNSEMEAIILSNAHHTSQAGTTRNGEEAFDSVKDRFAKEFLALLSQYPVLLSYARDHDWGIGCGEKLQLKLREIAQTDAETVAAQNVVGVCYD
ncbi:MULTISPECIES: hypothetical protein [Acidithiobacillus]|uniref:Uncharacterized protein n=2 Tax=Acidithiobacillus thiooxidans TaxID=930 RepID=A0A1C2IA68_ACITH|nr:MULTISPECIES: hypothetical protein [Acidithiobacillus]MDA8175702.1 hypothetical protein [Acidithiobacillus sp.]OCX72899.1 hypothetical protein A6M23_08935 [Acidithiobacillus thiooxidans]OCX81119.1 hypothetical protein A6P08_14580 [Acidithiobacillus thiooxidans]